jgi:hypothetical protein
MSPPFLEKPFIFDEGFFVFGGGAVRPVGLGAKHLLRPFG